MKEKVFKFFDIAEFCIGITVGIAFGVLATIYG